MGALSIDNRLYCWASYAAAVFALAAICAAPAHAQSDSSSRPLRIIVGFLPASSNDLLARFIGSKLTERLGQQVVVENRPGASGIIAAEHTSRATPDGHTLMLVSVSHTMAAAVYGKLPYDPVKSLAPVATVGAGPLVVAAHTSLPPSIKGVIDLAKAKPKSLNYASAGTGGINHFGAALFSRVAGVQMTHVPYKGGAPALADVIAGHVQLMWGSMPLTLPQIRADRIRALAVTSRKRSPMLPEVPTIAESGAPGAEIDAWWGILAPAGVPSARLGKLNAEIGSILREPESARKLSAEGAEPWITSSAEFARVIGSEIEKWTRVAREAGIRAD
jgi:tripartite-type tricarboxylate transporter receptor subunit TctC